MERKNTITTKPTPSLPTDHAFVVQLRSVEGQESVSCHGRIEHIVSGQAARFESLTELWLFMEKTLMQKQPEQQELDEE